MEKHAKIIVVANQKGGVGKSTTAEALADGLMVKGFRTLLIDMEPQGNISVWADEDKPTVYEMLTSKATVEETIQQRKNRPDLISASQSLAIVDLELTDEGKEYTLKEKLHPIKNTYDYIIIDTPPSLGIISINAFTACTGIIVPTQADIYSLSSLGQLYGTIQAIQQYTNPDLRILGILLTRFSGRSKLSRDMAEMTAEAAEQFDTTLFKTNIRECVAIKEAQAMKKSIFAYSKRTNAYRDYLHFVDEFLEFEGVK